MDANERACRHPFSGTGARLIDTGALSKIEDGDGD